MISEKFQKLVKLFSNFPTVGQRTATRFVYYILKLDNNEVEELINEILELRKNIRQCPLCFNLFEIKDENDKICPICSDRKRDKSLICLVEKETDLLAIEAIKKYNGLYLVLGGTVGKLDDKKDKETIEKRVQALVERIQKGEIKEVILALNQTLQGKKTADFVKKLLKDTNVKISQLGRGLPTGGELEYADEETLLAALESRKTL
jgi:recombination protein RecR